jgi:hypothetical protein
MGDLPRCVLHAPPGLLCSLSVIVLRQSVLRHRDTLSPPPLNAPTAPLTAPHCSPLPRYCPQELLNSNYHHLDKADIFGLGATLYELATGAEMPKGGAGYQRLRQGKLALLPHCSKQFQDLLKVRVWHGRAPHLPA